MIKRHLLDGQQRSNAIALGYFDPFPAEESDMPVGTIGSILWLDLFPDQEAFKSGSTRHYLFRVTTSAHPWGYSYADNAGPLHAHDMREMRAKRGLEKEEEGTSPQHPQDDKYQRPSVLELWPAKANIPIPLAWLILEADRIPLCGDFWTAIKKRCEGHAEHYPWARIAAAWLAAPDPVALSEIEAGISRARRAAVAVLEVPSETIHAKSRQESNSQESNGQNVANVEHLFQRLNNGGTPISSEELQYSMIKAYWPGIEDTISRISPRPMRASRLAMLGSRAAFVAATPAPDKIPGGMSISALRALATDSQQHDKRELVERYFEMSDTVAIQAPTISHVLGQVDCWLLQRDGNDHGLPPALRTAIAHGSPEVYLLLMIIAQRVLSEGADAEAFRMHMLGLATALHWFSQDQHAATQRIYTLLHAVDKLTPDSLNGILHASPEEQGGNRLLSILDPAAFSGIVTVPGSDDKSLQEWDWAQAIIEKPSSGDPVEKARLENHVWPFACRVIWCKELLVYAQRRWLQQRFKTFDQADSAAWEDHNRPWDYDHLLAQHSFSNVRNALYLRTCQRWGGTIGNFHILSFEENRSRGNTPANQAFKNRDVTWMLLESEADLDAFSLSQDDVRGSKDAVLSFVKAAHRRIHFIYENWYSSLCLKNLLSVRKPAS